MVTNDSDCQDKEITFPQHLANINSLVYETGFSSEIRCKWHLFMASCITMTIFTDQTVHNSQILPECKLFVLSIEVICDHLAISTVMLRSSYMGKHKDHCYVG